MRAASARPRRRRSPPRATHNVEEREITAQRSVSGRADLDIRAGARAWACAGDAQPAERPALVHSLCCIHGNAREHPHECKRAHRGNTESNDRNDDARDHRSPYLASAFKNAGPSTSICHRLRSGTSASSSVSSGACARWPPASRARRKSPGRAPGAARPPLVPCAARSRGCRSPRRGPSVHRAGA